MNAIDALMDIDPLELTDEELDQIISFHRKNRQNHEAGIKPKKDTGPELKLDLVAMGIKKIEEPIKRRF